MIPITVDDFYDAIKAGTIEAGTATLPNGHTVEVFHDGYGWVRREINPNRVPTLSEIIAAKVAADANHPCRIHARFRWAGTDNDVCCYFNAQDEFDTFCKKYPELVLQDVEYSKAKYIKGYTSPSIHASFRPRL